MSDVEVLDLHLGYTYTDNPTIMQSTAVKIALSNRLERF